MTMTDADIDAWLGTMAEDTLPDDGFSAAVMRRVRSQADAAATVPPRVALALLEERSRAGARRQRWRAGGLLLGALLAGTALLSGSDAWIALQPLQGLALAAGAAISAGVLALMEA